MNIELHLIATVDRGQPPWYKRLMPHGADWIPVFLSLGVFANYLASHRSALQASRVWSLGGVVLLLLALDRWATWRYRRLPPLRVQIALFALRCLLIEAAVQIEGFELSAFLYLILPFTALLAFGILAGYVIGGLVWGVFALKLFWADPTLGSSLEGLLIFAMGVLFILVLSQIGAQERAARMQVEHVLGALQHAHQELADSHRQLARYATQAADLATSAERNRLAREIHDGLGHYLTGIAVQLEKALAFRTKDAQEADHAVGTAKHMADQALGEVRRSVGLLREHGAPFVLQQALQELIAPLRDGPLTVDLVVAGDEALAPVQTRLALFRVIQEGLTNIQRHAHASHAELQIDFTPQRAALRIADDGLGFLAAISPASEGAGYGLQGIQQRIALLGGTVDITSAPGAGTVLMVSAPYLADANSIGSAKREQAP